MTFIEALQAGSMAKEAVMVTSPSLSPVTRPRSDTEAISSSEDDQMTSFSVVPVTDERSWTVLETVIVVDPMACTVTR